VRSQYEGMCQSLSLPLALVDDVLERFSDDLFDHQRLAYGEVMLDGTTDKVEKFLEIHLPMCHSTKIESARGKIGLQSGKGTV
jgi:hypothetical protein